MSAIANIVAYDGTTGGPVSHTFYPESVTRDKGVVTAIYREQNTSVPVYAQGVITLTKKQLASGIYRTSIRVEIPVMEALGGENQAGYTAAPKVAYTQTSELITYSHERSSIQERRLVRLLLVNIANNITASVSPATSGPAAELVDLLVTPV